MIDNERPSLELNYTEEKELQERASGITAFIWLTLLSVIVWCFSGLAAGIVSFVLALLILALIINMKIGLIGGVIINIVLMLLIGGAFYLLSEASIGLYEREVEGCRNAIEEVEYIKKSGILLWVSCSSIGSEFLELFSRLNNTFGIPLAVWALVEVACLSIISIIWFQFEVSKIKRKKWLEREAWDKEFTTKGAMKLYG
jgi:hypothetical protein